jgi:protoporphyrinogen oxidase
MRDVVIIGGGLTGLSAAWELEQRGLGYTLVEVKGRLGGSLRTVRENGFVVDTGAFRFEPAIAGPYLNELGLADALVPDGNQVLFRDGTQMLIDALAKRITQPAMMRMAVSSLGRIEGDRLGVCLENGLMLDAAALVVTAPARYAEHMLRSLQPEVAYRLFDYRYDSVARVSLGYRIADVGSIPPAPPEDYGLLSWQTTTHPSRVPEGCLLLQAQIRLPVEDVVEPDLPLQIAALMHWPLNPLVARADLWKEADSLTREQPTHRANMDAIDALLPPDVALAGSDYRARTLDQRVADGRAAAVKVANFLYNRK